VPDHASRQFIPPAPLFPLIGRADDVRRLTQLAADPAVRLMTITGPGGVGKTRLALQTAWNLRAEFASGVAFVPLAGVSTPDSAIAAMAQFFGIGDVDRAHLGARLRGFLQHRRLLLVLDNLEHVLPVAVKIASLLEAAPDVTVMATSRVLLNVEGEHRFELAPLTTPTAAGEADLTELASSPAVQLFVTRAAAIAPGFTLTEANGAVVSQICRLLDGLPLAIELAARRIRALAPDLLLDRLHHSLAELTGGEQTKPARHQTMRAAIAWSYDLLRPDHQALFRRLAVFSGGFTLDGVEAVALAEPATASSRARLVDDLATLTDASLIHHTLGDDDDRFEMLETIHRFGLDRLTASGDEPAVRRRHAVLMLSLAEAGDIGLLGSAADHRFWIRLFQRERANFTNTLLWVMDQDDVETALRLTGKLWNSWYSDGSVREGRFWQTRALAMKGGSLEARAIALEGAGPLLGIGGENDEATRALEEAIAIRKTLRNGNDLARSN